VFYQSQWSPITNLYESVSSTLKVLVGLSRENAGHNLFAQENAGSVPRSEKNDPVNHALLPVELLA
jgi:hypothetical protein